MKISQLLIATACSLTMIGVSGVAVAQTTSPNNSNSGAANQNQTQNQGQTSDRSSTTTTPGTMNSTATDTGTTGSRMGRSSDDMRNNADGSTMRSERLARADRN